MLDSFKSPLVVAGRVLLALMFVMAGFISPWLAACSWSPHWVPGP